MFTELSAALFLFFHLVTDLGLMLIQVFYAQLDRNYAVETMAG